MSDLKLLFILFLKYLLLLDISYCDEWANINNNYSNRSSRQLLFPKNCVLQFAVAVQVPTKLSYRNLAANGGILLNLDLPDNITYFASPYSRSEKVNHHNLLELMHNLNGMDGKSCIQKSICQLREIPFEGDDLYQHLLQILFTPKHSNSTSDSNCDVRYPRCPVSIIDYLTEIYED